METKVNYTLVGAFVIGLGAALIAAILWLASGGGIQKKYDLYLALVAESVAGLNLNAPVKYRGVDVGKVRDIRLDANNPEQVRLLFAIDRGTPIKEDTVAVLRTQGLTGIAYFELDGGSRSAPILRAVAPEAYPVIRTKPSLTARLENVLTSVLAKVDSTSANVNKLFDDQNLAALKTTLADLAKFSHILAERKDTIDAGIVSAERAFHSSARLISQLDTQAGPVLERVGRGADALRKLGNEGALASSSAGQTIAAMRSDLKRISGDALPELQRLMSEFDALAASLRRLTEETERNPRAFLFGHSAVPEGPGESAQKGQRK